MDLQITDKINISLKDLNADLETSVEKYKAYILEETQGLEIFIGEENGDWVTTNVEECKIQISICRCFVSLSDKVCK